MTDRQKRGKKTISVIVAVAENHAIGKDNKLLWHISNDLKRFKKLTTGHPVIMGKKTYESLPVRPLPGRMNIVLTDVPGEKIEGCVMAYSIEEAIELCPEGEECFVMGGGSVYRQFLPLADKLFLTKVHQTFEADTFFPEIDEKQWKPVSREEITGDDSVPFRYAYLIYERIRKE
ncbi:MAG: dihydrofolate reductase [Bacteroidales bacterium]|nr:dihydrofolate reductase [Bacteroidales bacterium]